MRSVAASTLLTLLAGCSGGTAGDSGRSTLSATWQPVTPGLDGSTPIDTSCPQGASATLAATGSGDYQEASFACEDLAGSLDLLHGEYDVDVTIIGDSFEVLARSERQHFDLQDETSTHFDDIFVGFGFFVFLWELESSEGMLLTCADVPGENGVSATASNSLGTVLETTVDCEDSVIETRPLPSDESYRLTFSLLGESDQPITTATISSSDATTIHFGNEIVPLIVTLEIP